MAVIDTTKIIANKNNAELAMPAIINALNNIQANIDSTEAVAGTAQQASVNTLYVPTNASLTTITLPATAAVGTSLEVCGQGAGGWKLAQNAGQTINKSVTATTAGTGGSLASGNRYNTVTVRCVVADTAWVVTAGDGTYTIV